MQWLKSKISRQRHWLFAYPWLSMTIVAASFIVSIIPVHAMQPSGPYSAVLISRERSTLAAEIAGQIIELPFDLGLPFKKGDTLVRFDCRFLELALSKAEREEEIAKKKWESLTKLAKLDSTGELQVELSFLEWKKLEIDRRSAALVVSRCQIQAPYDGRVIRHTIQPFEYVSIGQPLLEIVGTRNIEIESAVPASVALRLKIGQALLFHAEQQPEAWPGTLIAISPVIDPVSQLVAIRGKLDTTQSVVVGTTGAIQLMETK